MIYKLGLVKLLVPIIGASIFIVLNFGIKKNFLFFPNLLAQKKTGPVVSSFIRIAVTKNNGKKNIKKNKDNEKSKYLLRCSFSNLFLIIHILRLNIK